jgi:hypothetical protein
LVVLLYTRKLTPSRRTTSYGRLALISSSRWLLCADPSTTGRGLAVVGRDFDGSSCHARCVVRAEADPRVYDGHLPWYTYSRALWVYACTAQRAYVYNGLFGCGWLVGWGGGVVGPVKVGRPVRKLCALSWTTTVVVTR